MTNLTAHFRPTQYSGPDSSNIDYWASQGVSLCIQKLPHTSSTCTDIQQNLVKDARHTIMIKKKHKKYMLLLRITMRARKADEAYQNFWLLQRPAKFCYSSTNDTWSPCYFRLLSHDFPAAVYVFNNDVLFEPENSCISRPCLPVAYLRMLHAVSLKGLWHDVRSASYLYPPFLYTWTLLLLRIRSVRKADISLLYWLPSFK